MLPGSCGRYWLLFAVTTFVVLIDNGNCCLDFAKYGKAHNYKVEKPRMEFHSKGKHIQHLNHETILVNKTGMDLKFDCWAPFPIDFKFFGHVSLSTKDVVVRMTRKAFTSDVNVSRDERRFCYRINVTLAAYEDATGNFSCFAVGNFSRQISYYVFVSPSPPEVLLKKGQTLYIPLTSKENSIILPCATSNPAAVIELFKEQHPEKIQHNIMFDPKVGFIMNITTSDLENDFDVTPKYKSLHSQLINISCLVNGDAYFKYNFRSMDAVKITKNSIEKLPQDSSGSDRGKFEYIGKFITDKINSSVTGSIALISNKTGILYTWTVSIFPNASKPLSPNAKFVQPIKEACKEHGNVAILCQECNNWVQCNINKCLSKDKQCSATKCTRFNEFPNAVIQCFNPNNPVSEIYFTGLNSTVNDSKQYNNWADAPKEDILRVYPIMETYPSDYSKHFQYCCEGSSFVFSTGFEWMYTKLDSANATAIEFPRQTYEIKDTWGSNLAVQKSVLLLKSIPKDAARIVCIAPVWNTTETRKVDTQILLQGNKKSSSNTIKASTEFALFNWVGVVAVSHYQILSRI